MKKFSSLFLLVTVVTAMLLSACGAGAPASETSAGGSKPVASLIEFTGVIESMNGNQWVVGGQTITVDPSAFDDDETYQVGDTIEVKGEVQADGSILVVSVSSEDDAGEDSSNENDDSNSNDDVNENDDDNSNDDGNENDDDNSNDDGNDNDDAGDDNSNDDGNENDDASNENDNDNDDSNDDDNDDTDDNDSNDNDDENEDNENDG